MPDESPYVPALKHVISNARSGVAALNGPERAGAIRYLIDDWAPFAEGVLAELVDRYAIDVDALEVETQVHPNPRKALLVSDPVGRGAAIDLVREILERHGLAAEWPGPDGVAVEIVLALDHALDAVT